MTGPQDIEALLAAELGRHPLGAEVLTLAERGGVKLSDLSGVAQIVARLDAARGGSAPGAAALVLFLAALLDRLGRQLGAAAPPTTQG